MLFKILFASLLVSMSRGDGHKRPVGYSCDSAMSRCSMSSLSSTQCRSTLTSFMLDAGRHDQNNDCWMEGEESLSDTYTYYDPNGDGYVCNDEFSDRRHDYLGLSREFSDYVYRTWSSEGCIQDRDFKIDRTMSIEEFIQWNIMILVEFCNQENRMTYNRDCWSLSFLCEGGYEKTGDACDKYDYTFRSLNQKLRMLEEHHDLNGDGTVTNEEALNNSRSRHDMNKDGCVEMWEYQDRMSTVYGFSKEYGAYVYGMAQDVNRDGCLKPEEIVQPIAEEGFPAEYMYGIYLGFAIDMCHKDPSLWENNPECAMVVDYCRKWYGAVEQCKNINNQCGMKAYERCLGPLADGDCYMEKDRREVMREQLKVDNRLADWCTPYDGEGVSAGPGQHVPYTVVLLLCFLLTYLLRK